MQYHCHFSKVFKKAISFFTVSNHLDYNTISIKQTEAHKRKTLSKQERILLDNSPIIDQGVLLVSQSLLD